MIMTAVVTGIIIVIVIIITNAQHLLCVRHCVQCFTKINTVNLHCNPMGYALLLFPVYR